MTYTLKFLQATISSFHHTHIIISQQRQWLPTNPMILFTWMKQRNVTSHLTSDYLIISQSIVPNYIGNWQLIRRLTNLTTLMVRHLLQAKHSAISFWFTKWLLCQLFEAKFELGYLVPGWFEYAEIIILLQMGKMNSIAVFSLEPVYCTLPSQLLRKLTIIHVVCIFSPPTK